MKNLIFHAFTLTTWVTNRNILWWNASITERKWAEYVRCRYFRRVDSLDEQNEMLASNQTHSVNICLSAKNIIWPGISIKIDSDYFSHGQHYKMTEEAGVSKDKYAIKYVVHHAKIRIF